MLGLNGLELGGAVQCMYSSEIESVAGSSQLGKERFRAYVETL